MILNKSTQNGVQILKPANAESMSKNRIRTLNVDALSTSHTLLSSAVDFFPGVKKSWGLDFLINEEPVPARRSAGSLSWAGLFNSYYWIDRG
jgi:hypothetical protein